MVLFVEGAVLTLSFCIAPVINFSTGDKTERVRTSEITYSRGVAKCPRINYNQLLTDLLKGIWYVGVL